MGVSRTARQEQELQLESFRLTTLTRYLQKPCWKFAGSFSSQWPKLGWLVQTTNMRCTAVPYTYLGCNGHDVRWDSPYSMHWSTCQVWNHPKKPRPLFIAMGLIKTCLALAGGYGLTKVVSKWVSLYARHVSMSHSNVLVHPLLELPMSTRTTGNVARVHLIRNTTMVTTRKLATWTRAKWISLHRNRKGALRTGFSPNYGNYMNKPSLQSQSPSVMWPLRNHSTPREKSSLPYSPA